MEHVSQLAKRIAEQHTGVVDSDVDSDGTFTHPDLANITSLRCNGSMKLVRFPPGMINVRDVQLRNLPNLKSLPTDWVNVRVIYIGNCPKLSLLEFKCPALFSMVLEKCSPALPNGMSSLRRLVCVGYMRSELPSGMVNLEELDCHQSFLRTLPRDATKLVDLNCSFCLALQGIPWEYDHLIYLNFEGCHTMLNHFREEEPIILRHLPMNVHSFTHIIGPYTRKELKERDKRIVPIRAMMMLAAENNRKRPSDAAPEDVLRMTKSFLM